MSPSEFDSHADTYYEQHSRSIALSGEEPEFFSEYKVADARRLAAVRRLQVSRLLDFGSGIGNSIPYFRKHFPGADVFCADASQRALAVAAERFPGPEHQVHVKEGSGLDLPDGSFDLCFSACVFHHIAHDRHGFWLGELRRVTRAGGMIVIFEHNPLNPLTTAAVRSCPFDVNARLMTARKLARTMRSQGWRDPGCEYRVFFPHVFSRLRPLERFLVRLPAGAQYSLSSVKTGEA